MGAFFIDSILFYRYHKGKRGGCMFIRKFENSDAEKTHEMIAHTLRTTNIKDYTPEFIEETVQRLAPEVLISRGETSHFYVLIEDEQIIGCGGIAGFWGSETESILLTIFIHPDYQGKGYGRQLIETLEADEYFKRAVRIEIPASITAVGFYQKMGYDYKDGISTPDEEQHVRLEKFPNK